MSQSPENSSPVFPPSLVDLMIAARKKGAEQKAEELDPSRERTDPSRNAGNFPNLKPAGAAAFMPVGRPPGAALDAVQAGQGLDKFGRPVREPNVGSVRGAQEESE